MWKQCKQWETLFLWAPKSLRIVTAAMKLRHLLFGRKAITNLDRILKSFVNKVPSSQSYGFSSSHACMWELDYKESWAQKNWCFWTVVLEKTLESPLDCKEIHSVNPKGYQTEYCKDMLKMKLQYFGHLMQRIYLVIWKDPDAGKG